MLARTLATAAGALALIGLLASTASAATLTAHAVIQGAGTVIRDASDTCTQAPGVSEQSEFTCPKPWSVTDFGGAMMSLDALPAPGWKFDRWEGCLVADLNECLLLVFTDDEDRMFKPKAIFKDVAAPEALNLTATPSTSEERTVVGTWDESEPNVAWKCSTDTRRFVDCASPYTVTLPEGGHGLTVYGTDVNGKVGPPAKVPVTILDTELTAAPAPDSTVATPASAWVAKTGHGKAFECSLDGRPFEHCGTPDTDGTAALTVPAVTDGTHTLRVRARRGDAVDAIPATRTWTVDTTPRTPAPVATPQPPAPSTPPPSGNAAPITVVQHIVTPAAAAPAPAKAARFGVKYTFRKGRFTKLTVHGIPAGTKLTVSVKRPGKRATKTTLKRLIGKRLKPGTTITLRAGTAKKVLKIRHGRGPSVR